MPTRFPDVLQQLRERGESERHKGGLFEKLMREFFKKDSIWGEHFSEVELWEDSPYGKVQDIGIDLVAESKDKKEVWAIQCKFYDSEHALRKEDIDSFISTSGKNPFTHRLIVSTTDKWSRNAEKVIEDQTKPLLRIGTEQLSEAGVDWGNIDNPRTLKREGPRDPLKHHQAAIKDVLKNLQKADRGKLVMACGTGKTHVALNIAEGHLPKGGAVLFLVPSISLLRQSLVEWGRDRKAPQKHFAVCSDAKAGKDNEDTRLENLGAPVSTDASALVRAFKASDRKFKVVFSTYQSLKVIKEAQRKHGLPDFDLVICDEAHRTTGVAKEEKDQSSFLMVHDNDHVRARKRLYMTATPRLYTKSARGRAKNKNLDIFSMDDHRTYGEEFHRLDFSDAISKNLLSDYKVFILRVDEGPTQAHMQQLLAENKELKVADAAKIAGCIKALNKQGILTMRGLEDDFAEDPDPMRRAVAFCATIRNSKAIAQGFEQVSMRLEGSGAFPEESTLPCEARHVDGKQNAQERGKHIQWLKDAKEQACHLLSNARCLGEGVDVQDLDAVLFLNPRKSEIDIVQAVGRVMRKVKGKKYGYIILPIFVPAGETAHEALDSNEAYGTVWNVLRALRSHDNRFDALVNKLNMGEKLPPQIIIGVPTKEEEEKKSAQLELPLDMQWVEAIRTEIVKQVGNRAYWATWAKDTAGIFERVKKRITELVEEEKGRAAVALDQFLKGLRAGIHPELDRGEAIEMLAQHFITAPIFQNLFEEQEGFVKSNPVSQSMEKMLGILKKAGLEDLLRDLAPLYKDVQSRVEGIDKHAGRQEVISELYGNFFKTAFPKVADRLGIVYTPIEAVDFTLKSADYVLRQEFGKGLGAERVHIIDPFTGTGSFVARLLELGTEKGESSPLISDDDLERKFSSELHANEILLLAYYIATVNIESAYHRRNSGGGQYTPFAGSVLTDTFQMTEAGKKHGYLKDDFFEENSERARKQNQLSIRVILGNPPWSRSQKSENDANKNTPYSGLDESIRRSYAAASSVTNKNPLYDSYIRAIRWASDRLNEEAGGVIAYVTNGGFIDSAAAGGLRRCLVREFDAIYCFDLQGDLRGGGKEAGENVFGQHSRTGVAILVLVKHPEGSPGYREEATLRYHRIGDYLSTREKLDTIKSLGDLGEIPWEKIRPDAAGNWIRHTSPVFQGWMPLGDPGNKRKKKGETIPAFFESFSQGVKTNRDAWAHNFSRRELEKNMKRTINFYNAQLRDFQGKTGPKPSKGVIEAFLNNDPTKISWDSELKVDIGKGKKGNFELDKVRRSNYRPFCKQWLYLCQQFNSRVYLQRSYFPEQEAEGQNRSICVTGKAANVPFSTLMVNSIPGCDSMDKGQTFPFYRYQAMEGKENDLLETSASGTAEEVILDGRLYLRYENILENTLRDYRKHYADESITKWDIFHFLYGILHEENYRKKYASDLNKGHPRVPLINRPEHFPAFRDAGKELGRLHLGYEDDAVVEPYPLDEIWSGDPKADPGIFRVAKIMPARGEDRQKPRALRYNDHLVLSGIPEDAWLYTVNGRTPLKWVMNYYTTAPRKNQKEAGIPSLPNDYSDDPRYIINLIKRLTTLSIKTREIINSLPAFKES